MEPGNGDFSVGKPSTEPPPSDTKHPNTDDIQSDFLSEMIGQQVTPESPEPNDILDLFQLPAILSPPQVPPPPPPPPPHHTSSPTAHLPLPPSSSLQPQLPTAESDYVTDNEQQEGEEQEKSTIEEPNLPSSDLLQTAVAGSYSSIAPRGPSLPTPNVTMPGTADPSTIGCASYDPSPETGGHFTPGESPLPSDVSFGDNDMQGFRMETTDISEPPLGSTSKGRSISNRAAPLLYNAPLLAVETFATSILPTHKAQNKSHIPVRNGRQDSDNRTSSGDLPTEKMEQIRLDTAPSQSHDYPLSTAQFNIDHYGPHDIPEHGSNSSFRAKQTGSLPNQEINSAVIPDATELADQRDLGNLKPGNNLDPAFYPLLVSSSKGQASNSGVEKKTVEERQESILGSLSRKFVELLEESEDGVLHLNVATEKLNVKKRRIYDITNILEGIGLIEKSGMNTVQWSQSFKDGTIFEMEKADVQRKLDKLKDEELQLDKDLLDIQRELEQLKSSGDNSYMTHADINSIPGLCDSNVIAINGPGGKGLYIQGKEMDVKDGKVRYKLRLKSSTGPLEFQTVSKHTKSGSMETGEGKNKEDKRSSGESVADDTLRDAGDNSNN